MPIDSAGGERVRRDIQAQTRQVLNPLRAVLETAGSLLEKGVKTTRVIADMNGFGTINAIDAASFAARPPARACVQVARLPKRRPDRNRSGRADELTSGCFRFFIRAVQWVSSNLRRVPTPGAIEMPI